MMRWRCTFAPNSNTVVRIGHAKRIEKAFISDAKGREVYAVCRDSLRLPQEGYVGMQLILAR
jgi:hypothetical protein